MGKLQDKVALITGSDSGIGQATAIEFARQGADVVVHYLQDEQGANSTREQVEAQGRRAIVVQGDHGYEDQVEAMFQAAFEAFGRVDILMNNASVDASGTYVADLKIEDFERTLRSNLIGQLICCKHFINHRKQQGGGGKIINTTSVHQEQARAGAADYDCSKGALRNLTRTLVLEVSEMGMTVNNIAPGMVLTPFNQKAIDDPDFREQQVQSIPLKRAAQPEEIGRLAVFLASSDADYVTGATYVMDGGLMQMSGQGA
ncbi:SDR family NAD(P)-dependent oxidoreductase [Geodermatophilus chilensis]|jgi:glucose 1-dehydrogenase|uniref:SDR family NAD(P)-dependent oxidoreductase n=1 Tax=Geodermatophilus chilensis TaxID=2035835 RepID=UPI000C25B6FA|nr:glucose 1-dehydrogenase [Geodermatophilus chilensis]